MKTAPDAHRQFPVQVAKVCPKAIFIAFFAAGSARQQQAHRCDLRLVMVTWCGFRLLELPHPTSARKRTTFSASLEPTIIFEMTAVLLISPQVMPSMAAVHQPRCDEQLRMERPHAKFLELVHRLDRETSGVLMLAKKRSALVKLHDAIRKTNR